MPGHHDSSMVDDWHAKPQANRQPPRQPGRTQGKGEARPDGARSKPESGRTAPSKKPVPGVDGLLIPEKPKRILIADDEHLIASGVASNVTSLGYEVVGPVSDGRAAIHSAETELPDMCLLDIRMPEMDGLLAANEIWSNMGIPTILISAFSEQEYIDRATETGVFAYLLKPVNAENLRVAIGIAWTRAKQHDVLAKRVTQLERTIENRKTIEQAKWALVQANGFDEPTAHTALQRHARTTRQKLHEVAAALLAEELDPAVIQPRTPPHG